MMWSLQNYGIKPSPGTTIFLRPVLIFTVMLKKVCRVYICTGRVHLTCLITATKRQGPPWRRPWKSTATANHARRLPWRSITSRASAPAAIPSATPTLAMARCGTISSTSGQTDGDGKRIYNSSCSCAVLYVVRLSTVQVPYTFPARSSKCCSWYTNIFCAGFSLVSTAKFPTLRN